MRRRRLLAITLLVLFSLFLQGLPPTPVRAQGEPEPLPLLDPVEPLSDLQEPESLPLEIPNDPPPALPSLTLQLTVQPEAWVAVGDVITATLTVANQAEVPAEDLTLTLPLPVDSAPVDPKEAGLGATGWQWDLGTLPRQGEAVVTATMRLTAVPAGEALVLEPQVTARGLDLPVVAVGGALVTSDAAGVHPPAALADMPIATATVAPDRLVESSDLATARDPALAAAGRQPPPVQGRFTPGQPATLRSRDGHVTVAFPAYGFDRPLTLDQRTLPEQRGQFRARGQQEPPADAGFHRGFGAFFLEATTDQGQAIHQFSEPLTITVRFTPAQLRVRHLTPEALTLYWFDEDAVNDAGPGRSQRGAWVPLATQVDAEAGTATATVDHFTGFQLSDGTSASSAFIPSLQGWQVSGFTGAASFSYPIEVPAGPNGIKPELSLSYSSAATDGVGGMRNTDQASWVGKGWSLDTGSISLNKIDVSSGTQINHYALTFNGRSFDLVRGAALVGSPDQYNPTHWEWRPTDESFIRVRAVSNGASTPGGPGAPGRGAYDYSSTYTRYKWQVWDKSGTLFTFAEDMWWSWANCSGSGAFAYSESNRWLLSSVTDSANNTITYNYARSNNFYSSCSGQSGTVDFDVWPTTITWAGNRYKVEFVSSARANDTQYDFPAYTVGGPVRETRRLDAIKVWSMQASAWQLVRQYTFGYDYSLYSDERVCLNEPSCTSWGANTGYVKLTLKSIQRIGAYDGTPPTLPALPATTFSYTTVGGSAFDAAGGWNRLTGMNNGQGGTLTMAYANIAAVIAGSDHFRNRQRVTSKVATDGQGHSYTWSYAYGTPLANTIGTTLGDSIGGSATPTSAPLYYNVFLDGDADYSDEHWLVHRPWTEFRGHSTMTSTAPDGSKVKHSYYQGSPGCQPAAGAKGSHAAITGDTCFQSMLLQDFLKGREYLTEEQTSGSSTLHATAHEFALGPVDYTWAPLAGLWRGFSYESATEGRALEGGSTASTRRTEFYYNTSCSGAAALDAYGNLGCMIEKNNGTVVRKTIHAYGVMNSASTYIVDRNIATSILDSSGRFLGHSQRFYDGNNQTLGSMGTNGRLTREIQIFNVPLATSVTNVQLNGRDAVYGYDTYGNQTSVTTYSGAGWVLHTGSAWSASAPGGGSTARTTTTGYESTFHAFAISSTNPLSQVQSANYDWRMGTLISVTDANNAVTSATYDAFGRMATLVKPGDSAAFPTLTAAYADTVIPFRYTYQQREIAGTANTRVSRVYYDGMGRQIETKVESKGTAPYQSIATFSSYDGLGRVMSQSQPAYVSEADSTAFNAYTNPSGVSGVRWTTTTYDGLGRVSTTTDPANQVVAHHYGVTTDSGAVVRYHDSVDADRHRTQERFDALGQRVSVYEINGNCGAWSYTCVSPYTTTWTSATTTRYAYTPLDLLSSVTDAKGNVTTLSYDSLGRKTTMSDPDMGAWSYGYDANGNLTRQTDAKSQTTCFWYDALFRLTGTDAQATTSCPGSQPATPDRSFTYDTGTNGKGRRTGMATGSTSSSSWTYDTRGRILSVTDNVAGMAAARTFSWSYDSADRVVTQVFPAAGSAAAETLSYLYDSAWRQTSVCSSLGGCYAQSASYKPTSQPDAWTLGNSLVQNWMYDTLNRPVRLQLGTSGTVSTADSLSAAAADRFDRQYAFDAVDNVTSLTDKRSGGQPLQSYSYDARDRLTSWTLGSTTQSYSYDTIGNLTGKAGVTQTYGATGLGTGSGPHQARSVGGSAYSYDLNGNLSSGGGRSYTWTTDNMPSSIISGGVTESYLYNADGARVKKTRSSASTYYLDGMWEEDSSGAVRKYYTLAGQPVAMREVTSSSNTVSYLQGDSLGSVSLTTNASNVTTSSQEFDPWGKVRSGGVSATDRNFTGQYLDDTGLLFYNARYYDPSIGRFVSADTVVPGSASGGMDGIAVKPLTVDFHEGGFQSKLNQENGLNFWFQLSDEQRKQAGSPWGPANAQALNRYSYVQNNPLKWTDPSGHKKFTKKEAEDLDTLLLDAQRDLEGIAISQTGVLVGLGATTAMAGGVAGLIALINRQVMGAAAGAIASLIGGATVLATLFDPTGVQDALAAVSYIREEIALFLRTDSLGATIDITVSSQWNNRATQDYYLNVSWAGRSSPAKPLQISYNTYQNLRRGL